MKAMLCTTYHRSEKELTNQIASLGKIGEGEKKNLLKFNHGTNQIGKNSFTKTRERERERV